MQCEAFQRIGAPLALLGSMTVACSGRLTYDDGMGLPGGGLGDDAATFPSDNAAMSGAGSQGSEDFPGRGDTQGSGDIQGGGGAQVGGSNNGLGEPDVGAAAGDRGVVGEPGGNAVAVEGGTSAGVGGDGAVGVEPSQSDDAARVEPGAEASAGESGGPAAGGSNGRHRHGVDGGGVTGPMGLAGDPVKSDGCGKESPFSGQSYQSISVGTSDRSYIIRVPDDYDDTHPYRLIMSYHPLGGTAEYVARTPSDTYAYYGLWDLAEGSTIFVAPEGISNAWNNSRGQDVQFSRQLITQLESQLCIDKARIFAEGFSMGGSMSYAMACGASDMIRGVAAHSGGPMSGCDKSNRGPVAYFMTHGTQDSVCTYPRYGVPQINDIAKVDGCEAMDIPNTLEPTDPGGTVPVCADFQGCRQGYPARACIFVGDHTPSPGGESETWVPLETWNFIAQF